VTHAERVATGFAGEAVYVFYLKPDAAMVQLLGLEREMPAVYAPFAEFQVRTIEVHDEMLAKKRSRLDPLGSVIISDAANMNSRMSVSSVLSVLAVAGIADCAHLAGGRRIR